MIEEILLAGIIGTGVGLIIGFLEGLRFWHKLDKDSYHIPFPRCMWCTPPAVAPPQEPVA